MIKTSKKREKSQPPWKLGERKWRLERIREKNSVAAAWKRDLILVVPSPPCHSIYKNAILPLRITKLPLLGL